MKKRADKLLVERGLAPSRTKAQTLISEGLVTVNGTVLGKISEKIDEEASIVLTATYDFVGRGAEKILWALERLHLDFTGKTVLDAGASTGGFTQIALERGAAKVYAMDVGHDQLAPELRENPKVENHEGINLRDPFELESKANIIVCDLSFISLKLVLPNLFLHLESDGEALILWKPQFEVGKEGTNKRGVVEDPTLISKHLELFRTWCKKNELPLRDVIPCGVKGKRGNQEYWCYFRS